MTPCPLTGVAASAVCLGSALISEADYIHKQQSPARLPKNPRLPPASRFRPARLQNEAPPFQQPPMRHCQASHYWGVACPSWMLTASISAALVSAAQRRNSTRNLPRQRWMAMHEPATSTPPSPDHDHVLHIKKPRANALGFGVATTFTALVRTEYRHQSCQSQQPAAALAAAAQDAVAPAAGAGPADVAGPGCTVAAGHPGCSCCHHPGCTGRRHLAGSADGRPAAAWCR
ncbi:hypothetical protein D3C81_963590 [compost metagenome]